MEWLHGSRRDSIKPKNTSQTKWLVRDKSKTITIQKPIISTASMNEATVKATTKTCHKHQFDDLNEAANNCKLKSHHHIAELQRRQSLSLSLLPNSNQVILLTANQQKESTQDIEMAQSIIKSSHFIKLKPAFVLPLSFNSLLKRSTAQTAVVDKINSNNFNNNYNKNNNNNSKHKIKSRSPCPYQKVLEVLLVVLLANVLASLLSTLAPLVVAQQPARNYLYYQQQQHQTFYNQYNVDGQSNSNEDQLRFLSNEATDETDEQGDGFVNRIPRRLPPSLSNQQYEFDNKNNNNINSMEDFSLSLPHFQRSGVGSGGFGSQNYKISPKSCTVGRIEGTCMFVWECIKSEGRHVGMCVDSFMFGSCCAHNYTENIVMPQTFWYTRPPKPVNTGHMERPRPPHKPHISGMTTIERPHGLGTLVIRPSEIQHQGALHRPSTKLPATTASSSTSPAQSPFSTSSLQPASVSNDIVDDDLESAASIAATSQNTWHSSSVSPSQTSVFSTAPQKHWQMTTEPNFITKPRPPSWEKPSTAILMRPNKPTKQPAAGIAAQQQHHFGSSTIVYSTTRRPTWPVSSSQQNASSSNKWPTITSRPKPTKKPSQILPVYTKPIQQQHIVAVTERPSSVGLQTQTATEGTTTTITKTRPNQSTFDVRPATKPTTTNRPTILKPIKNTQKPYNKPTTLLTTTTTTAPSRKTSTTVSTSLTSSSDQNFTTIESNEITDPSKKATVKTISAARSECGMPVLTRPETRIVGGKSAAFGRWPWQVSVRRTSFFGFSSTHRCGGALINENWIATAGHCVDDLLTSQIRIRVGEYDFSHVQEQLPYIERGVAKKVVHPQYNFFTYEYDLALVKLESPLEFAPHVSPICLPQTESLLIGMNATVTGWGRLSEGGTLPSVLQEVSVPIVSNDKCKVMFLRAGRQEFIPDIFLCAGYENGGQDSCQGDSGGPLQVKAPDGRFFLAGIISWGIGCAEANLPGVCTRISKFVPWILENVT